MDLNSKFSMAGAYSLNYITLIFVLCFKLLIDNKLSTSKVYILQFISSVYNFEVKLLKFELQTPILKNFKNQNHIF